MPKIVRAILLSIYCALILHLFKILLFYGDEEIIEINYTIRTPGTLRKIIRELKKNKGNLSVLTSQFKQAIRLPTDYKYILKWTQAFSHFDSPIFRNGQKSFIDFNCTFNKCFMTNDKSLLLDIRYFDAIIFDIENTWDSYPAIINPNQALIFSASESAYHDPVCEAHLDNYFHMTWTYKLDSHITGTYVTILDKNGTIVGPKINMTWINHMDSITDDVKKILNNKSRVVAWFVSNCYAESRQKIASYLTNALDKYNLQLDVYGGCGNLTCPRDRMEECLLLLQKKYYFYLAFENSLCEDYVTEKILYPLLHYTVPIVYGGADYTRFLPPDSYIDAGKLKADEVVALMVKAIRNPSVYHNYFRWHNHYTYGETRQGADVCTLCRLLHQQRNITTVKNLRQWWNPNYTSMCNV